MGLAFKKATKSQAKLRAAVFGPSGAGKTFTTLRLAAGLGGPIAVIDTERGSASKYADRFQFDVLELPGKTIDLYCEAIRAAAGAGYQVLIIDSLTHAWQELLVKIDQLARAKYKGNTWSAWSEGTPEQRKLVDAILGYPGHVLVTMRSKTEWAEEKDDRGRMKPVRVGMAPEQGKGIEYEFDLLLELNTDHIGTVIKDRSGKFQDRMVEKPGEDLGRELAAWLSDGAPAVQAEPAKAEPAKPEPSKAEPQKPAEPEQQAPKANGASHPDPKVTRASEATLASLIDTFHRRVVTWQGYELAETSHVKQALEKVLKTELASLTEARAQELARTFDARTDAQLMERFSSPLADVGVVPF